MKFARVFQAALQKDGYPEEWIDSAVSYKQLKKCIKSVQQELLDMGLNANTLAQLWDSHGDSAEISNALQYTLGADKASSQPRLILTIDSAKGLQLNASLAPETKDFLQSLVTKRDLQVQVDSSSHEDSMAADALRVASSEATLQRVDVTSLPTRTISSGHDIPVSMPHTITIEVPLVNDSAFFKILTQDMSGLDALQSKAEAELSVNICSLGRIIARLAQPSQSGEKTDLQPWRLIFSLYNDSSIFFSTREQDQFYRTPAIAHVQMQGFLDKLKDLGLSKKFQRNGSITALHQFIAINLSLLKILKFQELNLTARAKILKSASVSSRDFS
ncbi:hypothetical protein MMC11_002485 [Xylographa trunciseda]|nr:hypothetical protein [Xylographa trunciseda]